MLDLHRRKPSGLKVVGSKLDGLGNSIKKEEKKYKGRRDKGSNLRQNTKEG